MSDMNPKMVRNAPVEVTASKDSKNHPVAVININDEHEHTFDAKSRISRALETSTPKELSERLSGGQYFLLGNELIDMRDGQYNGFVHTDESIEKLMGVIGYTEGTGKKRNRSNTIAKGISLSSEWSKSPIEVPLYGDGGVFTSSLSFAWNPFVQNINSAFELIRLICTNGMIGTTSFLNAKIPLVNRWEEHLNIASTQIQNKVNSMMVNRISEMGSERASVADCQIITEHSMKRLNEGNEDNLSARNTLRNINHIANPALHLYNFYKAAVLQDRRLAAQLPSHLTTFDLWNMATEIASHTSENGSSSDAGLHKLANKLVFSNEDLSTHNSRYAQPGKSSFSDPEAAFFGQMK